jgi:hypothetical protein
MGCDYLYFFAKYRGASYIHLVDIRLWNAVESAGSALVNLKQVVPVFVRSLIK